MKFSTSDFSFSDFSLLVFPGAKRRAAFTLIELLTVVAIIGILAGIVISGISGVRKKANQVRCLSNLRQVGVAIIAYANDNKDNLPGPTLLGASSTYTKTSKQYLGYHLASYVSMRRPRICKRVKPKYSPTCAVPNASWPTLTTPLPFSSFSAACPPDAPAMAPGVFWANTMNPHQRTNPRVTRNLNTLAALPVSGHWSKQIKGWAHGKQSRTLAGSTTSP